MLFLHIVLKNKIELYRIILNLLKRTTSETTSLLCNFSFSLLQKIVKSRLPLLFDHISDLITTILKFLELKDPQISINSIELLNLTLSFFIQNLKIIVDSNDFFRASITEKPKVKIVNFESNDSFRASLTDRSKIKIVFESMDLNLADKSKVKMENVEQTDFSRVSLTEKKKLSFFEEEGLGGRGSDENQNKIENFENEKYQTQVMNKVWVLILEALRNRLTEENVMVVECCLQNYFEIILEYGGLFSEEIWKELNEKVIFGLLYLSLIMIIKCMIICSY